MTDLEQMERLARDVLEADVDTAHDGWCRDVRVHLARAVLAMMPVVKAAEAWQRTRTGQHTNGPQHMLAMRDTEKALKDAVDQMRRELGGER